ncbi:probable beta-hexosaminidase fdl isoform X3 [Neodiprion virginianus]|uniref:probable beta-hexosaminidase fdl isoform X3 n=1 Tax=Neodiprion virginianus TaxID=2961670 RepID=UPI001EE69786|nr:probable beta-hexosaminidase fdl isoform X3 [Neodiprion virginianus]
MVGVKSFIVKLCARPYCGRSKWVSWVWCTNSQTVQAQTSRLVRMMVGGVPSGKMRRALMVLILVMGVLFIAMYARTPPIVSLQPFTARRNFQSPWSWGCVAGRCERRAVRSSRTSLATCTALCGGNERLIWPRPTGDVFLGENSVTFHLQQISLVTVNTSDQEVKNLLEHAKDVFLGNIRSMIKVQNAKARSSIDSFVIYLSAGDVLGTRQTLTTDESYNIQVTLKGKLLEAKITGKTYYGVRHGLETLSQMIWWDEAAGRNGILRAISSASIRDKPTFGYRGLLIDTGRQFFAIEELKRVVDGMAASKLNTFHWHLSDSQSFPYDSPQFPEMARWGAFSGDQVYSPEDVKDLVDYAKVRGIRVLIEIDAPAHAGAGWQWGAENGFGELALCVDQQPWSAYCGEPNCGQLNPFNEHSYKILEGLYRELLDITELRDIIHIGGDEVNLECWAQYNNITMAMQAQNITDLHALWGDFETKALHRVFRANHNHVPKAVVVWSSPLTKRPYINTYFNPQLHVIQSWGGSNWPETPELLEDGFRVIISHVDAWYLDCGFGRWRETGEAACGEYRIWQTVYNHRPWKDYSQKEVSLILGGEAALWSEQVGRASLGPRLWPRASAFAERLWTDSLSNGYTIEENVYTRLAAHRELLRSRGLHTEPMWPQWCSENPGKCL